DLAGVVDVVDEVVERADALGQAALDVAPFLAAEHAWHEVERKWPFVRRAAAAAGLEGDALLHEDRVAPTARLDQPGRTKSPELLHERPGGWARRAVELEQPVEEGRLRAVGVDRLLLPAGVKGRCGCPRAHPGILPRWVRFHLRRMEKLRGSAMLTCHSCPSGQRPCWSKYSRAASSRSRSRSPAAPMRNSQLMREMPRPGLRMLGPPPRAVSLPMAMITSPASETTPGST